MQIDERIGPQTCRQPFRLFLRRFNLRCVHSTLRFCDKIGGDVDIVEMNSSEYRFLVRLFGMEISNFSIETFVRSAFNFFEIKRLVSWIWCFFGYNISDVIVRKEKKERRKEEKGWVLINIRVFYISRLDARKERKTRRPDNNLSFFTRKKTSALEISEDAFTPTILAAIVFFFRSLSPHAQPAIPLSSLHSPPLLPPPLSAVPCAQFIRQRGKKAQWAGLVSHFPPFNRLYFLLSTLNLRSTPVVSVWFFAFVR